MMENLRQKLAMAVKSIHWSYAIFWSISSTEPGVLTWCDGYYNGDIKTRKTVQAEEINDDDDDDNVGFQRTEELRQLYESLSAASETYPYEVQIKRPAAALSPEDLTDTEWYFLVCMTFEFSKGQGLPGRTLAKNTSSWLCNAHFADSKVFNRSLLAKSASIQTVVCFPYLEGVVEFGITEKVLEEQNIIKRIKASIFETPFQRFLEIENHLDKPDKNPVIKTRGSPKNDLDPSREPSRQFIDDDEDGEDGFFRNNSMGSSDCVSQNLAGGPTDLWCDDDSRYQCVLSTIFKNTRRLILGPRFTSNVKDSAFTRWENSTGMVRAGNSSQMLLKKMLYEVPKMHDNRPVWARGENGYPGRIQGPKTDDPNSIDERLSVLGSLVPSRGKADKVSLLDDTIEYLKTLEKRIESLQSDKPVDKKKAYDVRERISDNYANKRKASCDPEDLREDFLSDCITVSAVEKDVTIEIRCRWRDNMMLQVFDAMSSLNLESHSVSSSTVNGILSLSIESKLKGCTASTTKMIRQALQRVIGRY